MTERLLQYIWQLQYYNRNNLVTVEGESLSIFYPDLAIPTRAPIFLMPKLKLAIRFGQET
jgi:hypothetical protein